MKFRFQMDVTGRFVGVIAADTEEEAREAILLKWEKLNLDDIYALLDRPTTDDIFELETEDQE